MAEDITRPARAAVSPRGGSDPGKGGQ